MSDPGSSPPIRPHWLLDTLRTIAVGGLAGAVAGLVVGGLGGRLVMRVSALAAGASAQGALTDAGNRVGTITLGGTIELVVFGGLLTGVIGAVIYVVTSPWMTWAGRWKGVAFGVFLLGIAGEQLIDHQNRDFVVLTPAWLNVSMFAALIVLFGVAAHWMAGRLEHHLPAPVSTGPVVAYALVAALGVPFLVPAVLAFFSRDFCGCDDPSRLVGIFLVAAGVGTVLHWAAIQAPRLARSGRALGWAGTAGAFALGLPRIVSEITRIL